MKASEERKLFHRFLLGEEYVTSVESNANSCCKAYHSLSGLRICNGDAASLNTVCMLARPVDYTTLSFAQTRTGVCYKRKFVSKRGYVSGTWYVSEGNYIMKNHVNAPTSPKCTHRWVRFVFCNRPQGERNF